MESPSILINGAAREPLTLVLYVNRAHIIPPLHGARLQFIAEPTGRQADSLFFPSYYLPEGEIKLRRRGDLPKRGTSVTYLRFQLAKYETEVSSQPNWHVIGCRVLSQWGAGCFSQSAAMCKTRGTNRWQHCSFRPPEQVSWRSASEVRALRQTLQNKKQPSKTSVGDDDVTNCCHGDLLLEITSNSMSLVESKWGRE